MVATTDRRSQSWQGDTSVSKRTEFAKKLKDLVPDPEPRKLQRSIYIENALWERFKELCEEHGYSASEVASGLIKRFIEDDGK